MAPRENVNAASEFLPVNPEHGTLHPQNLVILAINGLAKLEDWRQQSSQAAGIALDGLNERVASAEARHRVHVTASDELRRLELAALFEPIRYPELWARQSSYHQHRAGELDNAITSLEQNRPFLMGLRRTILAGRRATHLSKARKAADKLLA